MNHISKAANGGWMAEQVLFITDRFSQTAKENFFNKHGKRNTDGRIAMRIYTMKNSASMVVTVATVGLLELDSYIVNYTDFRFKLCESPMRATRKLVEDQQNDHTTIGKVDSVVKLANEYYADLIPKHNPK